MTLLGIIFISSLRWEASILLIDFTNILTVYGSTAVIVVVSTDTNSVQQPENVYIPNTAQMNMANTAFEILAKWR